MLYLEARDSGSKANAINDPFFSTNSGNMLHHSIDMGYTVIPKNKPLLTLLRMVYSCSFHICYDHFCQIQFMWMLGKSAWLPPCWKSVLEKEWQMVSSFELTLAITLGKDLTEIGHVSKGLQSTLLRSLRHIDIQTWTGGPENRSFR